VSELLHGLGYAGVGAFTCALLVCCAWPFVQHLRDKP
jgi:hypothetical protein